ncbi:PHD domain-containing protein/zf-HC5HC2H_2 domain-containing protein [Cephalotus follicularis]|uniref:PHD domain-containing protein/zf-HC5HC2H_2 domain-containing protein n=1 Tax=Cephalotus follicularis TaxID=3775 RepID=A0A1Q3AYM8_CEPFO|nr:PHD domain-containing protein/zf-HC5HC2H_2 domain-containing protein [Cephalotus follicularis]
MDHKLEALPPLKRFRVLQRQQQQTVDQNTAKAATTSLRLPAKKRKESRETTTTTYCLPAKKRVWAFQPEDIFIGDVDNDNNKKPPLSPLIDLNIDYNPCFNEDKEIPLANGDGDNESNESNQQEEDNHVAVVGDGDDDEDDDGIVCAVCRSTDADPIDPIVFCDGCDLMAHVTCYGDPLTKGIPDGDWFCKQCSFSPSNQDDPNTNFSFSCCLCPAKGGAMKPTNDGKWAHIVCALLVPEVFFGDPEGREEIDCCSVPKWRWEMECYVCKSGNTGCVIDCSEPNCGLAFHVTCGLSEDLCIEYREGKRKGAVVAGFCKDHTELWEKQQQSGKFKIVAIEQTNK